MKKTKKAVEEEEEEKPVKKTKKAVEEQEQEQGEEEEEDNSAQESDENNEEQEQDERNQEDEEDEEEDEERVREAENEPRVPPSFNFGISSTGPYSVVLSFVTTSSIYIWCQARKLEESVPSALELIAQPQYYLKQSETFTINDLYPNTDYKAYCYVESEMGVPMSLSVAEMSKQFHTDACKSIHYHILII